MPHTSFLPNCTICSFAAFMTCMGNRLSSAGPSYWKGPCTMSPPRQKDEKAPTSHVLVSTRSIDARKRSLSVADVVVEDNKTSIADLWNVVSNIGDDAVIAMITVDEDDVEAPVLKEGRSIMRPCVDHVIALAEATSKPRVPHREKQRFSPDARPFCLVDTVLAAKFLNMI